MKSDVTFTAHFKQSSENPEDSEITTVEIVGATLSYKPGETPRATAAVAAADQGKYRIYDEWWQELNENDEPVAIWHSDDGAYSTLPTITAFESGKKYVYSVLLMPERAYDFGREVAATVNGNAVTAVPATDGYLSLPNVKTITPTGQITPPRHRRLLLFPLCRRQQRQPQDHGPRRGALCRCRPAEQRRSGVERQAPQAVNQLFSPGRYRQG